MDLQLTDKVALVTGGSRGIGKAIARQLAREGMDVALLARTRDTCEAAAAELAEQTGRRALPVIADTGDDAAVQRAVDQVVQAFDRLDVLVNCAAEPAGQATPPPLEAISSEAAWANMNVKVLGYLRCARAAAPHMVRQGWGRIINISGLGARRTGDTVGSMRNVAVVALTKNLADELGPRGVNATVVHPGTTPTERTPAALAYWARQWGVSEAEVERRWASTSTLGRLVTPAEIADVVAFLASPRSVAINGDTITVNGGARGVIYY
jgi:NAD(P)-dependent dehydrogenase (short-subunit alcohol dehydrogenase family)